MSVRARACTLVVQNIRQNKKDARGFLPKPSNVIKQQKLGFFLGFFFLIQKMVFKLCFLLFCSSVLFISPIFKEVNHRKKMDFRLILLILILFLDLGLKTANGEDPNSYLRFNSNSGFNLGSDSGANFKEIFTNKVIFQKKGYMANTVTDVSIVMDVPVYLALNFMVNQTKYLQDSLNITLVQRTKMTALRQRSRDAPVNVNDLDKYMFASLSKEIDMSVSFYFFFLFHSFNF